MNYDLYDGVMTPPKKVRRMKKSDDVSTLKFKVPHDPAAEHSKSEKNLGCHAKNTMLQIKKYHARPCKERTAVIEFLLAVAQWSCQRSLKTARAQLQENVKGSSYCDFRFLCFASVASFCLEHHLAVNLHSHCHHPPCRQPSQSLSS